MTAAGLFRPDLSAERLLTAIGDALGGSLFTVPQLIRHADALEEPALRAAIVEFAGVENPGRRLGKRLAQIEGQAIGGLQVRRAGEESAGIIWSVTPAD